MDDGLGGDVEPDELTAEKIATVIELIERIGSQSSTSAADHMRSLGRLNSLLADLEREEIGVFLGEYLEFSLDKQADERKVELNSKMHKLIRFSGERGSQLTRRKWVWTTEKEARAQFAALAEQGYEAIDNDIPF